jgi:hypothetical protein
MGFRSHPTGGRRLLSELGADVAFDDLSWSGPHELKPGSGLSRFDFLQQHRKGFAQFEPVAGGVCEEESALSNKASILDSSAASRLSSISSSFKRFSLLSSRFSLSSDSILSCLVRCSMSYTGRQLSVASKRRQGGKVEAHSDLVSGREDGELEGLSSP